MKALVLENLNQGLKVIETEIPTNNESWKSIDLKFAALNRRDYWITVGLYPGIACPVIMGSDGAGIYQGKEVLLSPNINWGENEAFQSKEYQILGLKYPGTFAEKVSIPEQNIFEKPDHLSLKEAAALPLAGLTAYRVLFTKCNASKGQKVFISGIGGGVALMAMQFAIAKGCEVFVSSSSEEKLEKAVEMGAADGFLYTEEDWHKKLKSKHGGVDVVIDSAGGKYFSSLLSICNPGAQIGVYGGTTGKWQNINPPILFFKQLSIHGSTMGSDQEFKAMLDFVSLHKIRPVVDSVFSLENGNDAMAKIRDGKQFGKIILSI